MSGSLPELQRQAQVRANEFCERFPKPRRGKAEKPTGTRSTAPQEGKSQVKHGSVYRGREPEFSPFFQLLRDRFDKFERVSPERYQKTYGYCQLRFCCVRRLRFALY